MNSTSFPFARSLLFALALAVALACAGSPALGADSPGSSSARLVGAANANWPGAFGLAGVLDRGGGGFPAIVPAEAPSATHPRGTAFVAFGDTNARLCEWDLASARCVRTLNLHVSETLSHAFHLRLRGDALWVLFGTGAVDDIEVRVYGATDFVLRRKTIVGRGAVLSFDVDVLGAVVAFEDATPIHQERDPSCRYDKGPCSPQVKQVVVRLGSDLHVHARTWFESWGAIAQREADSVAILGRRVYVVVPWWNARHAYALSLDTLAVEAYYEGAYGPNASCLPSCWSQIVVQHGALLLSSVSTLEVLDPDLRLRAKFEGFDIGRLAVDPGSSRLAAGERPVRVADVATSGRVSFPLAEHGQIVRKAWIHGQLVVIEERAGILPSRASEGTLPTTTWIARFEPATGKLPGR